MMIDPSTKTVNYDMEEMADVGHRLRTIWKEAREAGNPELAIRINEVACLLQLRLPPQV